MTDFAYGVVTLQGAYDGQVILDAGWISFYLLWGAAALHPSMRGLERPPADRDPKLTPLRLALLTCASLIAPAVELVHVLDQGDMDLVVIIGASAVLFGLVVMRMAGLVRQQERSVGRPRPPGGRPACPGGRRGGAGARAGGGGGAATRSRAPRSTPSARSPATTRRR